VFSLSQRPAGKCSGTGEGHHVVLEPFQGGTLFPAKLTRPESYPALATAPVLSGTAMTDRGGPDDAPDPRRRVTAGGRGGGLYRRARPGVTVSA
jgi:hypothetical protein